MVAKVDVLESTFTGNTLEFDYEKGVVRKSYTSQNCFDAERIALNGLSQIGYEQVPKIYSHGYKSGRSQIEMELIEGDRLEKPEELNDQNLENCFDFGVLVRTLHDATVGKAVSFAGIVERNVNTLSSDLNRIGSLCDSGRADVQEHFLNHADDIFPESEQIGLLHRDLRFDNLIRADSGALKFVDFEVCALGAPIGDLSRTILFELTGHKKFEEAFLEGYNQAPEFIEKMERLFHPAYAVEMLAFLDNQPDGTPVEAGLIKKLYDVMGVNHVEA